MTLLFQTEIELVRRYVSPAAACTRAPACLRYRRARAGDETAATEVAKLYVNELTRLQTGARVQDYLVLLISKRVRESLRRAKSPRFLEPSAFNPLPE